MERAKRAHRKQAPKTKTSKPEQAKRRQGRTVPKGRGRADARKSPVVRRRNQAGKGRSPGPDRIRLRGPEDLLARVPYVLGYHPSNSLVALALDAHGQCRLALRVDLSELSDGRSRPESGPAAVLAETEIAEASGTASAPAPGAADEPPDGLGALDPTSAYARYLVAALERARADRAVVVVYSDAPLAGEVLLDAFLAALDTAGIELLEAIRTNGRRWWSLTCANPGCCPPEGRPYDLASHPITSQSILRGEVALPDREELRRLVAPQLGLARHAMIQVTDKALVDLRRRYTTGSASADRFRRDGQAHILGLIERYVRAAPLGSGTLASASASSTAGTGPLGEPADRARPDRPTDQEVAWASLFLCDLLVRDAAWMTMTQENARTQAEFWRDLARRAIEPFDVAPTTLLAFAAWLAGDGAMANCALDRALAADPDYSMASLVRDVLQGMVPRSMWPPEGMSLAGLTGEAVE